jgi:hypothetical protein
MSDDILKRLHFREIALRFLDGFNPAPSKSIVIADCICSYDGPLFYTVPIRYQAHDFVHAAYRLIELKQELPVSTQYGIWLTDWVKEFGP